MQHAPASTKAASAGRRPSRDDRASRCATAPAAGASYCRERDLPRLLPLWPHEVADNSHAGRVRLLARLRRALRLERQRGLAGHWTYDLARHVQLLAAYRAEVAMCLEIRPAEGGGRRRLGRHS